MKSGNNRTAGNVASWAVGATLGVVLGLGLLIAGPRLIPGAATGNVTETTPAGRTAENPSEAAPTPTTETLEGSANTGETSTSDGAAGEAGASGEEEGTPEASAPTESAQGGSDEQAGGETTSGQTSGEAATREDDGTTVQEDTAASATPGTEVQASAEAGQTVYASNCAACHGQNGEGAIGPALNEAAGWNLAEFTGALREGKTPTRTLNATMPRFSEPQINNQQLADLHAYVQTLQ